MSKDGQLMPTHIDVDRELNEEVEANVISKSRNALQVADLEGIAKSDLFSFIWDEDVVAALDQEILRGPNSSGSSPSLISQYQTKTASIEKFRLLISTKRAIYNLLQDNQAYLQSLQRALAANRDVERDIVSMRSQLIQADAFAEEEKQIALMPTHAERVRLPLYPNIYKRVPLLALQSEQNELVRLLSSNYSWSKDDSARLKKAILRQYLRNAIFHLAESDQCPDNLLEVANRWTEKELLTSTEGDEEVSFDWIGIAEEVGGIHTPEDCRTRWIMVDRPGIEQSSWSEDEKGILRTIIQKHLSHEGEYEVKDWKKVAEELNTGRLPIDCFTVCQQEGMIEKQSPVASGLDMSATPIAISELGSRRTIKWSSNADEAIVSHVARISGHRRPRLYHQLDKLGAMNFSKPFRGRPVHATAEDVEARWQVIKERWKKDPLEFSSKKSK